jgi:hypothetical protein
MSLSLTTFSVTLSLTLGSLSQHGYAWVSAQKIFASQVFHPMLCWCCSTYIKESLPMEWTAPQHEEIDLNCEISSYANAEI